MRTSASKVRASERSPRRPRPCRRQWRTRRIACCTVLTSATTRVAAARRKTPSNSSASITFARRGGVNISCLSMTYRYGKMLALGLASSLGASANSSKTSRRSSKYAGVWCEVTKGTKGTHPQIFPHMIGGPARKEEGVKKDRVWRRASEDLTWTRIPAVDRQHAEGKKTTDQPTNQTTSLKGLRSWLILSSNIKSSPHGLLALG